MDSKDRIISLALYHTFNSTLDREGSKEIAIDQARYAVERYTRLGKADAFTRANDARESILTHISAADLIERMADKIVELADTKVSDDKDEKRLFYEIGARKFKGKDDKVISEEIQRVLLGLSKGKFSFDPDKLANICSKIYAQDRVEAVRREKAAIANRVEQAVPKEYKVKNVNYNVGAVNYCREEVLRGTQIKIQNDLLRTDPTRRPRREYKLDNMSAVTDIGQHRNNQQDSVLILKHPKNPNYKMLVVADGMGGSVDGQRASMKIVQQMVGWFENLNENAMRTHNIEKLKIDWENEIRKINDDILRECPGAGSTFVGAIVGEKYTTIGCVGDSRAYVLGDNNELYQLTTDDNQLYQNWEEYWEDVSRKQGGLTPEQEERKKQQKDALRFSTTSNIITNCLGCNARDVSMQFSQIANNDYKTLMLFSDGVTDCLSDSQIMAITRNTDPKKLAVNIVNNALVTDSTRIGNVNGYKNFIQAGKDNTTAAILDKRQGGEER